MPLDLHVLSLSLAFILSQDQTLRCCISYFYFFSEIIMSNTTVHLLYKVSDTTDKLKPVSPVFESLIYCFVFNLSFGILTRGSVPCYLASLMHLHLSKSSFSQIFQ